MTKYKGMDLRAHYYEAKRLKKLRDQLQALLMRIAPCYPKQSRGVVQLGKALYALDAARAQLDGKFAKEYPAAFNPKAYFPGGKT